ncbi:MAG: gpW family head-tail joining protein [Pseudomonadota bacterium]
MNNCIPSGAPPAVDDPCAMLSALRAALYQLLSGQAKATVRNGDQWLEYHRGDAKVLQQEVRRLELICGSGNQGRAIRVGPYVPVNAPHRRTRGLI